MINIGAIIQGIIGLFVQGLYLQKYLCIIYIHRRLHLFHQRLMSILKDCGLRFQRFREVNLKLNPKMCEIPMKVLVQIYTMSQLSAMASDCQGNLVSFLLFLQQET